MRWIIAVAAISLAGCASEGERAEAEYGTARSAPITINEACAFERRIEQAYLRDGNEEKYQRWRLAAASTCNQADIDRLM